MKKITFTTDAFKEYNDWVEEDFDMAQKITLLIRDIQYDSFKGLGKPEPLEGNYSGYWSRRINLEHRLIYRVTVDSIEIIKCRGHYKLFLYWYIGSALLISNRYHVPEGPVVMQGWLVPVVGQHFQCS
jgi:toxin YoeB